MLTLLRHSLLPSAASDTSARSGLGRLFFYNGAYFEGELLNRKPKGQGKLFLPDGSTYEGFFDEGGITEGSFKTFNGGAQFTGKFSSERFFKGKIAFAEGEELVGEWGPEQGKWALKSGTLKSGEEVLFKFDGLKGDRAVESTNKTIHRCHETYGFVVVVKQGARIKDVGEVKRLMVSAEGIIGYEESKGGKEFRYCKGFRCILPVLKKEEILKQESKLFWAKTELGINVQINKEIDVCEATFDMFKDLLLKGSYENTAVKFKLHGKLFSKKEQTPKELGLIKIKHSSLANLRIKFNDEKFNSISDFYNALEALGLKKTMNPVQLNELQAQAKPAKAILGSSVLKMMIKTMGAKVEKDVPSTETSD